jgi:hypothetical protein
MTSRAFGVVLAIAGQDLDGADERGVGSCGKLGGIGPDEVIAGGTEEFPFLNHGR